jgi:hypothetical protein
LVVLIRSVWKTIAMFGSLRLAFMAGLLVFGTSLRAHASLPGPALQVGRMGLGGAVVGAAAGTVMWPVAGSVRTVFLGASVGLYLGLAAGLYREWDDWMAAEEQARLSARAGEALGPVPPWVAWSFRF